MWAWIDRSAWAAMGQETPGVWSWPRAVTVIVVAAVCAAAIYALLYSEPAFLVGLAIAYAFVLWRARRHEAVVREEVGTEHRGTEGENRLHGPN